MAIRVWNQTIDPAKSLAGTLTCVTHMGSAQRWIAVTAAHVVAPFVAPGKASPSSGDDIVLEDGGTQYAGKLWFWCDLQSEADGFSNEFDTALIELAPADAQAIARALNQPANCAAVRNTTDIAFDGISSGRVNGRFDGLHVSDPLLYGVLGGTFSAVTFKDSLRASLHAKPGDSGAMVTDGTSAVGMLIGSEGVFSRFLPLEPLMRAFRLEWVDGLGEPSAGASPHTPVGIPSEILGDRTAAADTLARTLWGEARGEKLAGLRAVAAVVLNRASHRRVHWWGRSIVGVCRAPMQFSCWNGNDPNLPKLLAVTTSDSRFKICQDVADEALDGLLGADCKIGATHYHTKSIRPKWAAGKVPCADVGNHLFYNNIE